MKLCVERLSHERHLRLMDFVILGGRLKVKSTTQNGTINSQSIVGIRKLCKVAWGKFCGENEVKIGKGRFEGSKLQGIIIVRSLVEHFLYVAKLKGCTREYRFR